MEGTADGKGMNIYLASTTDKVQVGRNLDLVNDSKSLGAKFIIGCAGVSFPWHQSAK